MQALGHEFKFDTNKRRIRCSPHFIDLTVQSILYGNKSDNIGELFENYDSTNEEDALRPDDTNNRPGSYDRIEDEIMTLEDFPPYLSDKCLGFIKISQVRAAWKIHNIGVIIRTSSQVQE